MTAPRRILARRTQSLQARLLLLALALLLPALHPVAAEPAGPATLHLSFDDFGFLEHDFVARGGHKSIEDRGLTLEEGRFGRGLRMNLTPHIDLRDEMSGGDLDEVVAVIFRTWRHREHWTVDNQPFLWGAGRFNTGSGAVAFWVKGELTEGELFNQSAMAWGRAEKHLLAITADGDGRLGAHLVDARYARHEIRSRKEWDPDRWNHVVLNWDKARGLELVVNGRSAASSRGRDAWWQTALPGLFHLPMPHVVYDELHAFSRPLERDEIEALARTNTPALPPGLRRASRLRGRPAAAPHAEVKLRGFDGDGGRLRLLLDPPPLILLAGDRIWLDVASHDNARIRIGGQPGSRIVLKKAPLEASEAAYESKGLMPVVAEATEAHYRPWIFERISPMDHFHTEDLTSTRFHSALYELGDPHIVRRALETAWHLGKPDRTPQYYFGGEPFLYDYNVLRWYWGNGTEARLPEPAGSAGHRQPDPPPQSERRDALPPLHGGLERAARRRAGDHRHGPWRLGPLDAQPPLRRPEHHPILARGRRPGPGPVGDLGRQHGTGMPPVLL